MERIIRREGERAVREQIVDYYANVQIAYNSDGRLTMRYMGDYGDGDVLINFTARETRELLEFVKKLALTRKEMNDIPF